MSRAKHTTRLHAPPEGGSGQAPRRAESTSRRPPGSFLTRDVLDPAALLASVRRDGDGGLASFVGVVRNENEGARVKRIEYTAYEEMAEREMGKIAAELAELFPATRVRFLHRLGTLAVGEASVAIAAASPHRAEAFAACREAIERIKARAPIWKKEF